MEGGSDKEQGAEIVRAETAGFCMGVSLALRKLDEVLETVEEDAPVMTYGPIIHNPQVLEQYAAQGVRVAGCVADVPEGGHVVIRAHGVPRDVLKALEERGATIVDATCPKVKKAQLLISRQTVRGRSLLLFGEADHPEVKGLVSHAAEDYQVFDDPADVENLVLDPTTAYFLAAQTTQDKEGFAALIPRLRERAGETMPVLHTICDATRERQQEAIVIAREVDVMVVVGGRESGNTRRLALVVREESIPCVHVETAEELNPDDFKGRMRIGLTAGASTPKTIIDAVERRLRGVAGEAG